MCAIHQFTSERLFLLLPDPWKAMGLNLTIWPCSSDFHLPGTLPLAQLYDEIHSEV